MTDAKENPINELVSQVRERLHAEISALSEVMQKLAQSLEQLRERQHSLEHTFGEQLDAMASFQLPVTEPSLEGLLSAVRNLITATLPEQVFEVLTEEAEQMGVRAAVFDVRGKAAWGSSARGFGAKFSDKAFHALIVPLTQEGPFRQVYETGGDVEGTADQLKKNRNVTDKFRLASQDRFLLLPIRATGSVSAIFYADSGGPTGILPVEALKILTEFAGAQLDRLMALSGGLPEVESATVEKPTDEPAYEAVSTVPPLPTETPAAAPPATPVPETTTELEPWEKALRDESAVGTAATSSPPPAPVAAPPAVPVETIPAPTAAPSPPPAPAPPAKPQVAPDLTQLSEGDQKVHKDAKRFAKLLVSEIELYNKSKVAEGRKHKDLYKRLKLDIDRSRQTYDKRFAATVAKQFDYFHEELVRLLAGNDPSLLGPEYPGPAR